MDLSSGYPFWLIKYGLPYDYPQLQQDLTTDVLVLGGGISGALVAYHLINADVSCVVIDKRTIGLGSTCASTSLLQYEIDTPLSELQHMIGLDNATAAYRLCDESIDRLGSIAKKIKFGEFQKEQSLYYAAYKKDAAFIQREYKIRKQQGFDVQLLDEAAVANGFGFTSAAAILSRQGAQTNAYSFTHALHQHAVKKGARVYDRTNPARITHSKAGVVIKAASGHTIKAKKIVYATGYESVNYIDKKIAAFKSTYALCSEQGDADMAPFKNRALLWNTSDPYLYLRTTADNRILIGGRDEDFYNPAKRDKLLPAKTKALVRDFKRLYPGMSIQPEFSWCGTFATTKDGLPFIDAYKKLPNSYFALGFGGNGITFSQIAAEILTNIITGRKNKFKHIFSFDRI
jgi:glycine/D-amino acid oxidase-like deaminating enzyme